MILHDQDLFIKKIVFHQNNDANFLTRPVVLVHGITEAERPP